MLHYFTLAFLFGISSIQWFATLPNLLWISLLILASFMIYLKWRYTVTLLLLACCLGIGLVGVHTRFVLAQSLPRAYQGKPIEVIAKIVSLPEKKGRKIQFECQISSILSDQGVFEAVNFGKSKVSWINPKNQIYPGDQWQLTLKLKRPRRFANPGSFQAEKYYFENRISSIGWVVTKADQQLLKRDPFLAPINAVRYKLKTFIEKHVQSDLKGLIIALTIGVKDRITPEQWRVFQRTGTAHLMAISGLHIGLIASLCFFAVSVAMRLIPFSRLRVLLPTPWIAAGTALVGSGLYALLSGFSIPSQRAWIMLTVFMLGILTSRTIALSRIYTLSLLIILCLDPLASLSIGFWLSYVAVGVILYGFAGYQNKKTLWWQWGRMQWVTFIGLIPLSFFYFQENSLISPIANIIAVPFVSFLVVPFALIGGITVWICPIVAILLFKISAFNLECLWQGLAYLSTFPIWQLPAPDFKALIFALLGVLLFLSPSGLRGKYLAGISLFLPLLFKSVEPIPQGQFHFSLLDVGQGLASVVQTQHHTLVYDTGPKLGDFDAGQSIVMPFLKTQNIKKLDRLLVSHADLDHIGGAKSILASMPVEQFLTSDLSVLTEYHPQACHVGQRWVWDGVLFEILHPGNLIPARKRKRKRKTKRVRKRKVKRNDSSCVLKVSSDNVSVLFTGDIEKPVERALLKYHRDNLQSDILVVPHHGSKTSSSELFIQAVAPKYALFSTGFLNRYGHPKPEILDRYQASGSILYDTAKTGAVLFKIGQDDILDLTLYRIENRKVWHDLE